MSDEKICVQFSKFIIPFKFGTTFKNLDEFYIVGKKGNKKPLFKRTSQKSQNLRRGIDELLLDSDDPTKVCDIFNLNKACYLNFGLPNKDKFKFMSFYGRGNPLKEYKVCLNDVNIYLFESGVGFVETEFGYQSDSIEDMIECNYFISETKSDKNYFESTQEIADLETKAISYEKNTFRLLDLVNRILDYVVDEKGQKIVQIDNCSNGKAILYSYVCTGKEPEDINELMFHLRKNFKASYKFPKDNGVNPYVKRQFENSYWGASFNGAVNLSYLVGEEKTDKFFLGNFKSSMQSTYFTLFLHILHQRYALMKFIDDMGTLDKLSNDYSVMKSQLKRIKTHEAETANLKFRAFFKQPSLIEHVNDYYALLRRTYRIDELSKNYESDRENLKNICETYVTRINERDKLFANKRMAKIEIFVAVFGTVVGLVSLFNDYWEIVEKIFGNSFGFISIQVLIFFGLLLLPIVTITVDVYYRVKEIRKVSNDLKSDLSEGLVEDDKERKKIMKFNKKHKIGGGKK